MSKLSDFLPNQIHKLYPSGYNTNLINAFDKPSFDIRRLAPEYNDLVKHHYRIDLDNNKEMLLQNNDDYQTRYREYLDEYNAANEVPHQTLEAQKGEAAYYEALQRNKYNITNIHEKTKEKELFNEAVFGL